MSEAALENTQEGGGTSARIPSDVKRFRRLVLNPTVQRFAIVIVALGMIEIAVRGALINPLFVPRPTAVLDQTISGLIDGTYLVLLGRTLATVSAAFTAAILIGCSAGFLLWRYPKVGAAYEPLLLALFSSPIVLAYPIFLVIFRRHPAMVGVLGFIAGVIPVTIVTKKAMGSVPRTLIDVGRVLRLSRRQQLRRVMLPAALPGIVSGMRLGLIYTLLTILAVEFVTDLGGLGAEISHAYNRLRATQMYAALALTLTISALLTFLVDRLETSLRWR